MWRQSLQRGGSIDRAGEAAQQRRGDGGQRGGRVGSGRAAAAAWRQGWQRWRQLSGNGQRDGSAVAVAAAAAWQRWRQQQGGNDGQRGGGIGSAAAAAQCAIYSTVASTH